MRPWITERIEACGIERQILFDGGNDRDDVHGKIKLATVGFAGHVAEEIASQFLQSAEVPSLEKVWESVKYEISRKASKIDHDNVYQLNTRLHYRAFTQCVSVLNRHWNVVSGIAFYVHRGDRRKFKPATLVRRRWPGMLVPDLVSKIKETPVARGFR